MEKASQDLQHPQIHQQALKCPRCDSSNTKFCYYNNYSLAQPRHFCKGCKRYWTRGGTLRNVPVGGGCRKNKRVKRSNAASSPSSSALLSTTQNAMIRVNPFLRTQSDAPLRFPNPIGSDLESQLNAFELGFSSQNMITTALGSCGYESRGYGDNGKDYKFEIDPTTPFANVITSSSLMVNLPFFLGSSSCSTSTTATSLISSSFQQEDLSLKETRPTNNFQVFNVDEVDVMKDMKVNEEGIAISQNSIEPMGLFDSSVYWPSSNVGANWPDLVNYGSSFDVMIWNEVYDEEELGSDDHVGCKQHYSLSCFCFEGLKDSLL